VSAVLPPALAVLTLLLLWQALSRWAGVPDFVLPGPAAVARAGWAGRAALGRAIGFTLAETGIGLAIALVLAILTAVALSGSAWLRRAVQPLLVASQTVQILAVAPLLILWFGFGLTPKVLVVVLGCYFPLAVSLAEGLQRVDPDWLRLFASLGARPAAVWRHLRLPAALPAFFAGLKIAVTYSVVSATIGEWVGGAEGLGLYMLRSKNALRVDQVFAGMLVTSFLSMALFALVALLERAALPWRRAARDRQALIQESST
jgi:ABC-type nitrate/sulfonate/bicarbonate transport system permease component